MKNLKTWVQNITPEMHQKLTDAVVQFMSTGVLPYYGEFALFINFYETKKNPHIKTAGVNVSSLGMNFYWDREFMDSLTQPQANFLIIHEEMHLMFDHVKRSVGYDQRMANIAQDMIINQIIYDEIMRQQGLGSGNKPMIEIPKDHYKNNSALFVPKEYKGEPIFEELYEWLMAEQKKWREKNKDKLKDMRSNSNKCPKCGGDMDDPNAKGNPKQKKQGQGGQDSDEGEENKDQKGKGKKPGDGNGEDGDEQENQDQQSKGKGKGEDKDKNQGGDGDEQSQPDGKGGDKPGDGDGDEGDDNQKNGGKGKGKNKGDGNQPGEGGDGDGQGSYQDGERSQGQGGGSEGDGNQQNNQQEHDPNTCPHCGHKKSAKEQQQSREGQKDSEGKDRYGKYGKNDVECYSKETIFEGEERNEQNTLDSHLIDEVPPEMKREIVEGAMQTLKNRGLQSGEVEAVLNKLRKTHKDYLKEIKRTMSNHVFGTKKNKTIVRPHRRGIVGLKGHKKYRTEINCLLDTSGSMGGEFEKVLSYIFQNDIEINLIQVDAAIQSVEKIKSKKELERMRIKGLGGTVLQPGIDYMTDPKNKIYKNNTVILTDGWTDSLNFKNVKTHTLILSTTQKCPITFDNGKVKQIVDIGKQD